MTKVVTVTTNDPSQQTIKLNLIVDVQVMFALEPFIINFGRYKKGETQVRYVTVVGEEKDKTKINVRYTLISPFAFAHIYWDEKISELVYDIEEPILTQEEKEINPSRFF